MAANTANAMLPVSAPSLLDLPDELIALMAAHLNLKDVCQLRATCHGLLRCSAVLARSCKGVTRRFERDGEYVPNAVLAWAVGGSPRQLTVRVYPEEEYRRTPVDDDLDDDGGLFAYYIDGFGKHGGLWGLCSYSQRYRDSGVSWSMYVDTPEAQSRLDSLSPAVRRQMAMTITVGARWLPAVTALADAMGFRSLSIVVKHTPPEVFPALLEQLAIRMPSGAPHNKNIDILSFEPYALLTSTAFAGAGASHAHLARCSRLVDVTALAGVTTVELFYCDVLTDVSALGGVRSLRLRFCPQLTDVSGLANVRELEVSYCPRLTDVSMLGGVLTLSLRRCTALTDVSALGSVQHLDLTGCSSLSDVSALGNVQCLVLSACERLIDVSALGTVHTLHLNRCRRVADVSALGGVWELQAWGTKITDVSALGAVHRLNLSFTPVTDVSALGGVHELILIDCEIADVSALGGVHTLNLSSNTSLVDVSALGNVTSLDLSCCTSVRDYSALDRVPYLFK